MTKAKRQLPEPVTLSPNESHDGFHELCALATTGELTNQERQRLHGHLGSCAFCRQVMREYDTIARRTASTAGPDSLPLALDRDPCWSLDHAELSFFARLEQENPEPEDCKPHHSRPPAQRPTTSLEPLPRRFPIAVGDDALWRHIGLQYAAAIVLIIALGVCLYQFGIYRGSQVTSTSGSTRQPPQSLLEQQLSDARHERTILHAESEQRTQLIAELRREISKQSGEITRLKETEVRLRVNLRNDVVNKDQLAEERAQVEQHLAAAQTQADGLQERLDALTRQTSEDATRMAGLEANIDQLTNRLSERQDTIEEQQELLAHDRDIRELIGARDLYIAEVYDVARTGATQKPYGRVFYTKSRSLVFYAYDLDQESGIKRAKATFQAWGRRGPDWQQALNLGIFYEDNVAKKRWILRFNDPKALAQIDAVFVTVEPTGGSRRPSTKPLLFAYLRMEPNHP